MSQLLLTPVIPNIEVKRWTLDEYHRMVEGGYLGEDDDVELLEGWIVPKMPRNPPHDDAIEEINYALLEILPKEWRIRIQSALSIAIASSEPEPDLFVYRSKHARRGKHPTPEITPLVIEVSDSTLNRDRTVKQRIYARARIPVYWIVNLPDRQVEVYTDPSGPTRSPKYRSKRYYRNGASVPVVVGGEEVGRIAVSALLSDN